MVPVLQSVDDRRPLSIALSTSALVNLAAATGLIALAQFIGRFSESILAAVGQIRERIPRHLVLSS